MSFLFVKPQFYGSIVFENSAIQIGPKLLRPVDFLALVMEVDMKTLLILERLLLFVTTNAHIDVEVGEILLNINDKKEKFAFIQRVK